MYARSARNNKPETLTLATMSNPTTLIGEDTPGGGSTDTSSHPRPSTNRSYSIHSTPRMTPVSDSQAYQEDFRLEDARIALCDDLEGYVAEVSLEFFKRSVLPPLENVAAIEVGVAEFIKNDRWTSFAIDPKNVKEHEDRAFELLPELLNNIIAVAAPVLHLRPGDAKWKVQARPAYTLKSENNLHATYKPDGYSVLLRPWRPSGAGRQSKNESKQSPSLEKPDPDSPGAILSQNASDAVWLYELKKDDGQTCVLRVKYHTNHGLVSFLTIVLRIELR